MLYAVQALENLGAKSLDDAAALEIPVERILEDDGK